MDDRIEGAGKQATGSIKEAIGKITGDRSVEAKGAAEKAAGKAQSERGEAKAAARDTLNP
ncbi:MULTISPECIES: CsbD family protein [Sphingomonas]|uniref:CsbD family protein n=1 Tax=Sphingomonas TaxID=13687 RepID=UPI0024134166|nr:CsbD family protein [Sphingomonas echinoides]